MEKFIEVFDNVLSPLLEDNIENFILKSNNIKWDFNPNISGVSNNQIYGFQNTFFSKFDNIIIEDIFSPLFQVLYSLPLSTPISIVEILQSRLFLQTPSPTPGIQKSAIHTDLIDFPHWVCLYYVNDSDGDTVFYNDNLKEIKRVSPKKGRIVFFDGSIKHTGSTPKTLRANINFNFIGNKL